MCGRTHLVTPDLEELRRYLPIDTIDVDDWVPRFNIAPSQRSPVLRINSAGTKTLELLQWGIIPHNASKPGAFRPINARMEQLHQRETFRGLLGARHCIVPATGYYEWQRVEGKKQPWVITSPTGILAMAGLWDRWIGTDGTVVDTYAVITQPPRPDIAFIHDRMPVLLDRTTSAAWLEGDQHALKVAARDQSPLVATPISPLVNRPENDSPQVLEPVTLQEPPQLSLDLGGKPRRP